MKIETLLWQKKEKTYRPTIWPSMTFTTRYILLFFYPYTYSLLNVLRSGDKIYTFQ